jgi:hypothetical protein
MVLRCSEFKRIYFNQRLKILPAIEVILSASITQLISIAHLAITFPWKSLHNNISGHSLRKSLLM